MEDHLLPQSIDQSGSAGCRSIVRPSWSVAGCPILGPTWLELHPGRRFRRHALASARRAVHAPVIHALAAPFGLAEDERRASIGLVRQHVMHVLGGSWPRPTTAVDVERAHHRVER